MDTGPRVMNTTVDVSILQKLGHKDMVALLQKCHGEKVLTDSQLELRLRLR